MVRSRHTKHFFGRGLSKFCSRGGKVFHARKNKMIPEEKRDAFAKLIRWFRKKHWFFWSEPKITKKQCLFDKNIVLVFLFDGAVRPHESEPSFSKRTSTAACFFLPFVRKKPPQRSGAREKVSGLCTVCMEGRFSYRPAHFHPMKKSARGGPALFRIGLRNDEKKKFFLVREAPSKRTMDASPAFMEYRSVKKDRGLNQRTRDFLAQNVGAFPSRSTVKKHAAVDVLFEKEGSPCGSGYPVVRGLKNWGRVGVVVKVWQRQFFLRLRKKNPECAIQQNTHRQKEKTDSSLHNSLCVCASAPCCSGF